MRRSILLFLVICCFCGCGGGSGSGPASDIAQTAKLRVIIGGLAPAAGQNLSVIIDGTTVATSVIYWSPTTCGSVTPVCQGLSNYLTVKSGGVNFAMVASGSTKNLVPTEFQNLNLAPNTQNTFVLGGGGQIEGYLFQDDGTPANGSVKLRIANVSDYPSSTGVSAWVNTNGSTTGNPTISAVAQGSASSYLTLTPGSYVITFSLPCPLIPPPQYCTVWGPSTFAANQNITVYALNEGDTFSPLALADYPLGTNPSNQTATLMAYMENYPLGAISVLWNGQTNNQTVATGLTYPNKSSPVQVQAGTGTLAIEGPDLSKSPWQLPQYLTPNTTNDLLIWGWGIGTNGATLLTADTTPAGSSAAKLRVENCQNENFADVYVLPSGSTPSGNPTYSVLGCNSAPVPYQTLSPGTYDIFFTLPGTKQVVYEATMTLAANQNRTLILLTNCPSTTTCNQDVFTTLTIDDLN